MPASTVGKLPVISDIAGMVNNALFNLIPVHQARNGMDQFARVTTVYVGMGII